MPDDRLASALDLASRGLLIFPLHTVLPDGGCTCRRAGECKQPGKHPRTIGWQMQATVDPAQISELWSRAPQPNIGIITGSPSGVWVLDIDPRAGGDDALQELEAAYGALPETPIVLTGGGGRHLFWQHPGFRVRGASIGRGVDVRGDGNLVVGAGSIHSSGRTYEWEVSSHPDDLPFAVAPEWLLDRVRGRVRPPPASLPIAVELEVPAELGPIVAGCVWLRHCRDDAQVLPEQEWYAMLSIIGRVADGEQVAQEWSAPHPDYDAAETAAKLAHALTAAGPTTCSWVEHDLGQGTYCQACPSRGRITSPIVLGRPPSVEGFLGSDRVPQPEPQPLTDFGLDHIDRSRYVISDHGVYAVKDGSAQIHQPISTRPIWPMSTGVDLATGAEWVRLAWLTEAGKRIERWRPQESLASSAGLRELATWGAPISLGRANRVSDWLVDALSFTAAEQRKLSSSIGWVENGGGMRFAVPGGPTEILVRTRQIRGTIEGWSAPLRHLVTLGDAGYVALLAAAFSAAGPIVRLLGRRNPVIGLVAPSSRGKGTVIEYALSIWQHPDVMMVEHPSTPKGIQDKGIELADLPIAVDELQRYAERYPDWPADILYYLGNGRRRTTSTREKISHGGERRWGCAFYAAENPIVDALQLGAQLRAIEIAADPLPDRATAALLQRATAKHFGALAIPLAALAEKQQSEALDRAIEVSSQIGEKNPELAGDDGYSIMAMVIGLEMLQVTTGIDLPISKMVAWILDLLSRSRRMAADRASVAWRIMLEAVAGAAWGAMDSLEHQGHMVAWRTPDGRYDLNPRSTLIRDALKPFGGEVSARAWAARGWLERQGDMIKVQKRVGTGRLRVWRVTPAGLSAAGLGD